MGASPPPSQPTLSRLTRRAQFLYVRAGAKAVRPHVIVEARRQPQPGPLIRYGLTASKKVGNAVTRNRARRRLREAARQLLPAHGLAGADYVLVARPATAEAPWAGLLDDLQNALIRLRADLASAEAGAPPKRNRSPRPAKPAAPSTESD